MTLPDEINDRLQRDRHAHHNRSGLGGPLSDLALQSLLQSAWAIVVSQFATGYRPECHYMPDLGPKCREKQGTRDYQPAARIHAIGRS